MGDVIKYSSRDLPGIVLTDAAKQHIVSYLLKNTSSRGVRFSLKKSGCSGLSYVIDYIEEPLVDDLIFPILDNDYLVCVDKRSYPNLKGIEIDYVKQGLNYKFVFNNPNQTGACGCGESFTVES